MSKSLLVTVGTTMFDQLIKSVDVPKFYELLDSCGFTSLIIQKGNGDYIPTAFSKISFKNLNIEVCEYKAQFEKLISESDIVMSGCGAGTILETLRSKRIFLGTVNEILMDNHQNEIAEQMLNENYIYFAKTDEVVEELEKIIKNKRKPLKVYPEPNYNIIPDLIYDMMK